MKKDNSKFYAILIIAVLAVAIFLGSWAMSGNAIRKAPAKETQVLITSELTQADYDFLATAVPVGEVRTEYYEANGVNYKVSSQDYEPQYTTDNGEGTTTYSCVSSCAYSTCYPDGCDKNQDANDVGPWCSSCTCKESWSGSSCGSCDNTCKLQKANSGVPASNSPASR